MKNLKIEPSVSGGQWVSFDEKNYHVLALVFPEPSDYGINGGRISKLFIKDVKQNMVMGDYDREWLRPLKPEVQKLYDRVLKKFN